MNSHVTSPARFLFDTPLDGPELPPPVPHAEVEAMQQAHERKLDSARREAEAAGHEAGRREALAGIESRLARELEQLAARSDALDRQIATRLQQMEAQALQLALTAADRLAGSLIARQPHEQVEAFFRNCLSLLPTDGRVLLLVAPDLAATLEPRLATIMARSARQNTLEVVADADIPGADCRIVWPDGGIDRRQERIRAEIERIFATHFDGLAIPVAESEDKPA